PLRGRSAARAGAPAAGRSTAASLALPRLDPFLRRFGAVRPPIRPRGDTTCVQAFLHCSPGGGGPPLPEGIVPPSGRLRAAGRWEPLPALSELPPLRVVVPAARSPGSPGRGITSPARGCRFRRHPL